MVAVELRLKHSLELVDCSSCSDHLPVQRLTDHVDPGSGEIRHHGITRGQIGGEIGNLMRCPVFAVVGVVRVGYFVKDTVQFVRVAVFDDEDDVMRGIGQCASMTHEIMAQGQRRLAFHENVFHRVMSQC